MNMPKMIETYNGGMGGVDLADQMVGAYRICIRKRKWWWCFFTWSLSIAAINAWRLYRMAHQRNNTGPYLKFLRDVICQTLKVYGEARMRPGVALKPLIIRGAAGNSIRQDGRDHWIGSSEHPGQRLVCKLCNRR